MDHPRDSRGFHFNEHNVASRHGFFLLHFSLLLCFVLRRRKPSSLGWIKVGPKKKQKRTAAGKSDLETVSFFFCRARACQFAAGTVSFHFVFHEMFIQRARLEGGKAGWLVERRGNQHERIKWTYRQKKPVQRPRVKRRRERSIESQNKIKATAAEWSLQNKEQRWEKVKAVKIYTHTHSHTFAGIQKRGRMKQSFAYQSTAAGSACVCVWSRPREGKLWQLYISHYYV